ncbi:MAG TPA: hypothetical protein IAB47_08350 [Candidatus Scatomorpha merdigallinarum]|nr:hypothetical protein [Candidatus Scatomorpha merdigallinarum]
MLTIFNRAELLITFDAALYGRCTDALVSAGIPYSVRTQYTGHASRRSGMCRRRRKPGLQRFVPRIRRPGK